MRLVLAVIVTACSTTCLRVPDDNPITSRPSDRNEATGKDRNDAENSPIAGISITERPLATGGRIDASLNQATCAKPKISTAL